MNFKLLGLFGWLVASLVNSVVGQDQDRLQDVVGQRKISESWWPAALEKRISLDAPQQANTWLTLLRETPEDLREGIAFQLRHMPKNDLKSLTPEFLLQNTRLAYQAFDQSGWKTQVSKELFLNDVLPYANIDETREDWRADFMKQFMPLVKDCKTPGEAAEVLNRNIFKMVNVHYSTARRKANQSPSESIQQSKASCTGLSILLVDACRSVGIPARLAGIPSWVNKRGNHTWVEVWDGQWRFTGADEPSDQGLDHGWFEHDASLALKDSKMNSIYAVSFQRTDAKFPMVWSSEGDDVWAENVTDRYTKDKSIAKADSVQLFIQVLEAEGGKRIQATVEVKCLDCVDLTMKGTSRDEAADTNDFLTFAVVKGRKYEVTVTKGDLKNVATYQIDQDKNQTIKIHMQR